MTSFLWFLASMLLALVVIFGASRNVTAEIPWHTAPQPTLQASRASGKPILVFVTREGCPPCKKMKEQTWVDPMVSRVVSENFESLFLHNSNHADVVKKMGIRFFPTTLIYSPGGKYVGQKTGYMEPMKALQWMGSMRR
ncbi:MAG: thioredoxin fold domain-containing protein [Planctomycetota bacterium]